MRRRRTQPMQNYYTSTYKDIVVKGTIDTVISTWERMAYDAERNKDMILAQAYFQQAEHYKKMHNAPESY